MSITISSADGPLVREFFLKFTQDPELKEIDKIEIEQQYSLAGPNDNLHFLIEGLSSIAFLFAKEIGKK